MSDDDSGTTDEPTVGGTYTHERTFTPEESASSVISPATPNPSTPIRTRKGGWSS
jgi:hypothetical protein